MTADERKDAENYIASKLGTDPTPEELMEFCVRSHAKRRRLERGLDTFDRWFRIVCKRGEAAQRQNVAYFAKHANNLPFGGITDHGYRARHVREMLRAHNFHPTDATLKRWLNEARELELIPKLAKDDRNKWQRMSLTREELLKFVEWVVSSK